MTLLAVLVPAVCWAGEYYSVACMKTYKSDVVYGTAYQNFCLTPKKEHTLKPVSLICTTKRFYPSTFRREINRIKQLVKKADYVEIEVNSGLKMLISYYFKGFKNVKVKPRPKGADITIRFCKGGSREKGS